MFWFTRKDVQCFVQPRSNHASLLNRTSRIISSKYSLSDSQEIFKTTRMKLAIALMVLALVMTVTEAKRKKKQERQEQIARLEDRVGTLEVQVGEIPHSIRTKSFSSYEAMNPGKLLHRQWPLLRRLYTDVSLSLLYYVKVFILFNTYHENITMNWQTRHIDVPGNCGCKTGSIFQAIDVNQSSLYRGSVDNGLLFNWLSLKSEFCWYISLLLAGLLMWIVNPNI